MMKGTYVRLNLAKIGPSFTVRYALIPRNRPPSWSQQQHTPHATREAGATRQEIAEAAFVAAAVRAGGTLAHALLSLRLHDSPEK